MEKPNEFLGGEVTSTKFFVNKQGIIDEDGLLSERIFGPVKNFQCKCGKLKLKSIDSGKTCPKCHVLCDNSELRLKTFGTITPIFSVIKPTKKKYIKKLIGSDNKHLFEPNKADIMSTMSRYLTISTVDEKIKVTEDITSIKSNWYLIPLRITGIYSFILSLKFAAKYLKNKICQEILDTCVLNTILVLPPDVRPVMRDPKKNNQLRFYETNKHYVSIITLNKQYEINKAIKIDKEDDINQQILYNLQNNSDDEVYDILMPEFDLATAKYQYYVNKLYETVYDVISGKDGFIRSSILGKTIEFSARTAITIDPSIPPYQIKVSKRILYKLWFPYFINWLVTYQETNYINIFDKYVSNNYDENKEIFNKFLNWFMDKTEKTNHVIEKPISQEVINIIKLRRLEHKEQSEDLEYY